MSAMTSQSIDSLVKQIRKQHGEDAIVSFTGDAQHAIPSMPTGSFGLDMALGIGGYPRGRIIEIYGPESSGKTTLALHAIAECQRAGGLAVFVDAEHALDPFYARRLGVDMQTLLISQPDSGEQAFDIVESLARSEQVSLIVVDSVAALTPRAELEGEMGDLQVGAQARMMSKALRKLTALTSKTGIIILFINQIRMKVGVVYGSPETTPGGQALKFFASVRLDVRKAAAIKNGEEIIGNRTRVKVVKNKVAAPFRQVEFDILFGGGVQRTGEVLDAAAGCGVVQKSGSWFMFGEERLGQGRDRVAQLLRDQPALAANIERLLRERGALPALINAPAAAGDAGFN